MSSSLMAIKLLDKTVIFAKDQEIYSDRIIASNLKYKKKGEITKYIDDEMTISNDAIDVWFKILKGDKEPDKPTGDFSPKAPSPAA